MLGCGRFCVAAAAARSDVGLSATRGSPHVSSMARGRASERAGGRARHVGVTIENAVICGESSRTGGWVKKKRHPVDGLNERAGPVHKETSHGETGTLRERVH